MCDHLWDFHGRTYCHQNKELKAEWIYLTCALVICKGSPVDADYCLYYYYFFLNTPSLWEWTSSKGKSSKLLETKKKTVVIGFIKKSTRKEGLNVMRRKLLESDQLRFIVCLRTLHQVSERHKKNKVMKKHLKIFCPFTTFDSILFRTGQLSLIIW